ncbi:PTS sugar transporter subunit IIB [Brachyspira hyodysenteriae]|uniref:PTS system mannose/fructose/N-acetylgalactosamine-transporter subunit IIB n=1 Tax=Brachyspira hyodysenteriae TaxID=159 RepID=UPI00063D8C69|nr:PTS sugar transporter subunit IIB [Brachyspira hyodysenteriae]AUJ49952.1 PTS mannose transporter subunit IID [Brachyspira hyodysenteriae]KLI13203.1 PTS mannose transporter subunit IIAB [Brachyspira hyodysenteriae]KLI19305.1 PTS mannose transporter subunit IIAB [Brachyspira hyodysenteriae]KLI19466.1 PTS mannose transporter subunit IIAB [Brachyspira hyodysenteriae]KLI22576.1 PTS mannose transporter subunit IIAB [Brachyspira hyodysenteriae]
MSIVNARVDERLIHGQVAMVWTNTVGATRIAVVNDQAVKDETIIAALKISKPAGVKLSILSKAKAAEKFKEGVYDEDKIFLITKNIEDMNEIIKDGVPIETVNIGNVAKKEGSVQIKKSVNLTDEDIALIKDMIADGIKVTAQMLPNESDQSIEAYLK